jgi:hypothetical protein
MREALVAPFSRGPTRRCNVLAAVAVALARSACGGRTSDLMETSAGDGRSSDASPVVSRPPDAEAGAPPTPDVPPRCESAPKVVRVIRQWSQSFGFYGLPGPGMFLFSGDSRRIAAVGGEYMPELLEYRARDGVVLSITSSFDGTIVPLARDRSWNRELRSRHPALEVIDTASAQLVRRIDAGFRTAVTLSADGAYVIAASCVDPHSDVRRWAVDFDELVSVTAPFEEGCGTETPLAVMGDGRSALLGSQHVGRLGEVTFSSGAARSIEAHDAAPADAHGWPLRHAIISIGPSPTGRYVATIGTDRRLRRWSYPELIPSADPLPTSWTTAFGRCYCQPKTFAPVAWSPDEAWFAAPDAAGDVMVRRTCDGGLLATIPLPAASEQTTSFSDPGEHGPWFLAFAPDGALAVAFDGGLHLYRFDVR